MMGRLVMGIGLVVLAACSSSTSEPSGSGSTQGAADGGAATASAANDGTKQGSSSDTTGGSPAASVYEAPAGSPCVEDGDYALAGTLEPADATCAMGTLAVAAANGGGAYSVSDAAGTLAPKACKASATGSCSITGTRCNWERPERLAQGTTGFVDILNGVKVTSPTTFVIYGSEAHVDQAGAPTATTCTWTLRGTKR